MSTRKLGPPSIALVAMLALAASIASAAEPTHAYSCLLELRAIDDQADTAIRELNAERLSRSAAISAGTDIDAFNLASEAQRAAILDRQHAALNAVRSRCYPHRARD